MPLATGEVTPAGITLTMILGSRGSWPARAPRCSGAQCRTPEVQAASGRWRSISTPSIRLTDASSASPSLPLRNFTARDLYVRRGGPIREPTDLAESWSGVSQDSNPLGGGA
jgi:4,5-dihydroxyphthalate decarboxylase